MKNAELDDARKAIEASAASSQAAALQAAQLELEAKAKELEELK